MARFGANESSSGVAFEIMKSERERERKNGLFSITSMNEMVRPAGLELCKTIEPEKRKFSFCVIIGLSTFC